MLTYEKQPDVDEVLIECWMEALVDAYRIALGDARARIRLRYVPLFNEQGLHPYSFMIGKVWMLESILGLGQDLHLSPRALQRAADQDALAEFEEEVRNGKSKKD